MRDWVRGNVNIDTLLAFVFGISFLLIAFAVSLLFPQMRETMIVQVIVALSAAAITAGIPGLFTLTVLSPGKVLTIKITGALLVFMLILAVDAKPRQSIAFIQMSLILLTPLLVRWVISKQLQMKVAKSTLLLLSTAFMLCEAAFFSQMAGGRLPEFPYQPDGIYSESNLRSGQDLICTKQQNLWVTDEKLSKTVAIEGGMDKPDELHLLLAVEWKKWEKFPTFPRNYRGQLYYQMRYQCQDGRFTQREIKLIGYSLRPGKIVLSWLIGFIEIPFLFDGNNADASIQQVLDEKLLHCFHK